MRLTPTVAVLLLLSGCYQAHGAGVPPAPTVDAGRRDSGLRFPDLGVDAGLDGGTDQGVDIGVDIERDCAEGPLVPFMAQLDFPILGADCPWNIGDNLSPMQEVAAARVEEARMPPIPSSALVCDLTIQAGGAGVVLRYDDNFALLVGDVVLAASDRGLIEDLPTDGDLRLWRWSQVRGRRMEVSATDPYCLGQDEGRAECEIPPTDTPGVLRLDFDEDLVRELALRTLSARDVRVTLVTIGDNDPFTDCSHGAFSVLVSGEIVP